MARPGGPVGSGTEDVTRRPPRPAAAPLRVAVIGLGLIGRRRAEALGRIEGAVLAATVDPAVAEPVAAGVPHHATLARLPADAYDTAVVAVPHDRAVALAAEVLAAGRPVLVEKPLGVRGADARALEALAADLPVPSFVGYNYRYLPAVAGLVRRARAGALGRLRNLDLLVGHGGHPGSAAGWKLDPVRAGGGVLLDPGVHLLDLLLLLAPGAECTGIEATRGFWPTGIEEDVVAVFRADRLLATVRVSHVRWVNTFRLEAFGEDGYALAAGRGGNYGPMSLRLGRRWAWRDPGVCSQRDSEQRDDFGTREDSLRDELADVVARWRGEDDAHDGAARADWPQPASMAEARRVTELCERLYAELAPLPAVHARARAAAQGR
jgi:1,5-anhydro-D-fructose reductase (1,5-anhydro-D-mannitol-forming)